MNTVQRVPWWRWLCYHSKIMLVWLAAGVGAFYLLAEHTTHVYGALPFLLLALRPLMHVIMHGGHGGHGGAPEQGQK